MQRKPMSNGGRGAGIVGGGGGGGLGSGSGGGGGGGANVHANATLANANAPGNAQQRRSLAYGLHQLPPQTPQPPSQPLPPSTYATMGMSMGNLGMTMTMSNMDNSLRGFAPSLPVPQQPPLPAADSAPAPFWRPTALLDMQQHQQQQQQPHHHLPPPPTFKQVGTAAGLDLEFNDFLGGARDASGGGGSGGGDVTMGDVSSSFQVSSAFSSLSALSAPSSVAPLSMAHASLLPGANNNSNNRNLAGGPASSASTSPTSDASSTRSNATSAAMAGASAARPAVPVAAATGAPDATDYSRFVDSTDEPDLSQHKIELKNEKCQYHNCPNRARVSQAYGKFCNRHVIVAPCGFPGCRDKALLHSSMCDKHLAEGKEALHRILASRAQNVPVCRTFGCFKNDQGRGYCRGHEKLLMATGRLPKHINKRRLNSAYTMCSYPNCNKHSQRNHLCRTHGNVILKQAEEIAKQSTTGESFEDALARLQKEIRRCSHPTCTKNSQRDRLCTMHYYEKHNLSRDGSSSAAKEAADGGQLSGTDGGGESDGESGVCSVSGCAGQAHSGRGLCKYHLGQVTTTPGGGSVSSSSSSSRQTDELVQASDGGRSHPLCSIAGCGNVAPYASGLCQHHGNKTNQAIQITRMNPHAVGMGPSSGMGKSDGGAARPNLGDGSSFHSQVGGEGGHFLAPGAASSDPNTAFTAGLDRFNASGATGRMASLSVNGGMSSSSSAESDARHALVTLNGVTKQVGGNDARSDYVVSGSTTCSNPICSRDSYGRDFCESCQNIFSPLVVSVGDGNANSAYQFPSLGSNQSLQPEPEGEAMWDSGSQAKLSGAKSREVCRVNTCPHIVTRAGLCDEHFRLFQAGTLSVDEITLRSRQLREEKERATAAAAAAAAAEMKQISSPKIKKYFCKMDGCDKQAQKRGLCKRHFRMQETSSSKNAQLMPSGFGDQFDQSVPAAYHPQACRFPECFESVNMSTTLCPSHCKATYCWQSGCENLVDSPQFCDYHAFRRECAYEGCTYAANRDSSGCINHAMERRCSHEFCEQFATLRSDRCRLHADDCNQQPCLLCEAHGLRERGAFHNQSKSSLMYASGVKTGNSAMDIFHSSGGNNDFVDERELARDSVFSDRLLG